MARMPHTEDIAPRNTLQRFYDVLLKSDRNAAARLEAFQDNVLQDFLPMVAHEVPYYAERLAGVVKGGRTDLACWREIPVLSSAELRRDIGRIERRSLPPAHGHTVRYRTSGSTGKPMAIYRSALSQIAQTAALARLFLLFGLDRRLPMVLVRSFDPSLARFDPQAETRGELAWFPPQLSGDAGGPLRSMSVFLPLEEQLRSLRKMGPVILNTHPSHVLALAHFAARHPASKPEIAAVVTVGEYLTPDVRRQCHAQFGARCIDQFSSAECGLIAAECPDCGELHVLSELCRVELLGRNGAPVQAGEWGRLVVTPLYNAATPLIRYEPGDMARLVAPSLCGRSHLTLGHDVGRAVNLFRNGRDGWYRPDLDSSTLAECLGPGRWQLVQTGARSFTLRHMNIAPTGAKRTRLEDHVAERLPKGARVSLAHVPILGLSPSGKFSHYVNATARL